jgi:hypothetical protein
MGLGKRQGWVKRHFVPRGGAAVVRSQAGGIEYRLDKPCSFQVEQQQREEM